MKDSETMDSELAPFLMGISPFILLTLNGEIDLKFEDFDDVKELPMMEPLLANFSQIFEGATTQSVDELLADKMDFSELPESV